MQEVLAAVTPPPMMGNPQERNTAINHRGRAVGKMPSGAEHTNSKHFTQMLKTLEEDGIFPLKKKSMKFPKAKYFCRLCDYHCDNLEICKKHSQDNRHRHLKETKLLERTLSTLPTPAKRQYDAITDLLEKTTSEHGITAEEIEQRIGIKHELEKKLREVVPESSLEVSGSTLSGFALKSSDLDLDVIVPDSANRASGLLGIKNILEKDNGTYTDVSNDLSSSYPCMSFTHKESGVRVVTGVASLASRNTNTLLDHYNNLDERVKKLVTVFKFWAKLCQIDSQQWGALSAHCFPIMAIHFLQQTTPPVLPVLHQLVASEDAEAYMNPKDINPPWKSRNRLSIGELWVKMFQYYALDFKTSVHVINVRHLKPFVRTESRWGKRMAIEDPFQIKRNMTHTVSSTAVFEFIAARFKTTYRYFVIPQMSFGYLFKHMEPESESLFKEKSIWKDTTELDVEDRGTGERASYDGEDPSSDEEEDLDDEGIEEGQEVGDEPDLKEEFELSDLMMKASISSPAEEEEELKDLPNGVSPGSSTGLPNEVYPKDLSKLNILDLTHTLGVLPKAVARHLMAQVTEEMLHYSFDEVNFTGGKKVPLHCTACQKIGHTKFTCTEDELPPLVSLPHLKPGYIDLLTTMFYQLKEDCAPRNFEILQRDNIVKELEGYIKQFFPCALLKLFGSSANGFGFGNSDLDICLTFEGSPTADGIDSIKIIEEISEKLKKSKECRQVLAITTAKVPIVKMTLRRAQLEADLSLYNTLALQNTKLLSTYTAIDYRVKVLGYTMKYFAKLCDIGDASRGSLSSYAYILMVLHFLQQCKTPVIPVLQNLYDPSKPRSELMIDGWNAWFHEDVSTLSLAWKDYGKNKQKVGELWVDMLRYFTEVFNWQENVITIRQSEPLTKLEKLWTTKCIAIEDPFDLSHNLGGGLSRKMNAFILKAFIRGRELFGVCPDRLPRGYPNFGAYLFDKQLLTDGAPPNDRGCRWCGRIGHVIKECPRKQQKREQQKKEGTTAKSIHGKTDGTANNRRPEPVPPPPRQEGSPHPRRDRDRVAPDEEAEHLPKDVTAPTAHMTPLRRPSLEMDKGEAVAMERFSPAKDDGSKDSSSPLGISPRDRSTFSQFAESPRTPVCKGGPEMTEISPSMLFRLASQLGGGVVVLSAAAHLPTTGLEKPVTLPPPGFAAQPPLGSSSGSVIPLYGLRRMPPAPPSQDLSTVNKNLRAEEPSQQFQHLQQQQLMQHHAQQTAQLLQLPQAQQLLRRQLQQQTQAQQHSMQRSQQQLHMQQTQVQQQLLLRQQLQQSQAQRQLQTHLQQTRLQQQPQLPQPQEHEQQPISQPPSTQTQQQLALQVQQPMPFQGRLPTPLGGHTFLSHVMTGAASQGPATQNTTLGIGSTAWGLWMTPPSPPGLVPNPINYSGPIQVGSSPPLSTLHLQQQQPHVSGLQQNCHINLSTSGGTPFPERVIKDLTPNSESPSFHSQDFGLVSQQQPQHNQTYQRLTTLYGNPLSPSGQDLSSLRELVGQPLQAFSNPVSSGVSCSPQNNL